MKNEKLDKMLIEYESEEKFKTLDGALQTLLHMYYWSKPADNKSGMLVIDDIIWENELKDFVIYLKKYGVNEICFGSTWSSALNVLMYFMENGYKADGTIIYKDEENIFGGRDIKKGIKLILK